MEKQHSEFDKILCDLEDATKRTCELERKLEAQRQETACANDQLEKLVFLSVCVLSSRRCLCFELKRTRAHDVAASLKSLEIKA